MHIRPTYSLPLLAILLCMSCESKDHTANDEAVCSYHISHNSSKESDRYVSAAKIIPLVTDGRMINDIYKFIVSNDEMFIFDKRMQSIYVFDSIGQQKSYFNRHGAGPGEYIDANDISLDEYNNLYIADIGTQQIIKYEYPDYDNYKTFSLGRAFTSFETSDDWFYISNLSEDGDLKIKLASRPIDNDTIRVLSMATVDNEYRAVGAGHTHLWRSDGSLLFYDRFTPFIYRLTDGKAVKYIEFDESDIPDGSLINELINLPVSKRYAKLAEPTDKIIDISSCFETSRYILMEVRTVPLKYIVLDKESGDYVQLPTLLTDEIRSSIGVLGTYGEYFVTATIGDENNNPEIIFFEIKESPNDYCTEPC